MNNVVEIIYESNKIHPHIKINGEELSRFSSLANYIYDDIFRWADKFFELIDGDLAEDYRVILIGHPYQAVILSDAAKKSEFCSGVEFKDYQSRISAADKFAAAVRLKNDLAEKTVLELYCDNPKSFSRYIKEGLAPSNRKGVPYCLSENEEEAISSESKYCIILSDKNECVKKKNNVYFFFVKADTVAIALDYFLCFHLYLSTVGEVMANIDKYASDSAAALEFEAYSKEEYRVWSSPLPNKLEKGESVNFKYSVFPACFPKNGIAVTSSDESVLAYKDGVLTAVGGGEAKIRICASDGAELFSESISVSSHNFATNITVILPSTVLYVGETLRFRCVVSPLNAEDADQITYSVSDEKIAVITAANELYALSPGRICLTVSTPRISSRVYITIPPQACDVALSTEDELKVPISSQATVYGAVVPQNANPMPTIVWEVKQTKSVIKILESNEQKCVFQTMESGRAVLVCRLKDTSIKKELGITVPKTNGCYVATAVYGSYDCPEVWVLRRYRDEVLDKTLLGRAFIKLYYAVSPRIVKHFGDKRFFNAFFKKRLDRKVARLQKKGFESTPYQDKDF